MESIQTCRSGTKRALPIMVPKNKTVVKNSVLDNIMQEYCLKRNQLFRPYVFQYLWLLDLYPLTLI